MDLKQMEYILKIAEEGNITKAAKKLYITQSALNQTLLKLEKEIGGELFKRNKLFLSLTEIGEIYIEGAKQILEIKNETYNKIEDKINKYRNEIKIGLTPERGMEMFGNIYPIFHKMYPNIVLRPIEASVFEQHQMIEKGELDLGFVNLTKKQKKQNNYQIISEESLVLVLPFEIKENNIENLKNEDFILLSKNTTIREIIDEYFEKLNFYPKVLFETKSSKTLVKMVEKDIACTIVSEIYVKENKNFIKLTNWPTLEYCAVYKKGKYLTSPMKEIIKLVKIFWEKEYKIIQHNIK